jgi:hypothetical protein
MIIKEEIKSTQEERTPGNFVEEQTHPSFGQIQISRVQGGNHGLYGSSIKHNNFIELRICNSRHIIDGEHEWYFDDHNPIIEVRLSQTQFAEMITTLNVGNGVPCTIIKKEGSRIEIPNFGSKKEIHSKNFSRRMNGFASRIHNLRKKASEILNGDKPALKKEKEELLKELDFALTEISSNIPYFEKQFQKQMDRTVMEAKGEVEAFVTGTIQRLVIESLTSKGGLVEIDMKGEDDETAKN